MDSAMAEQTQPQPIQWDAVKALAMVVGVREAARRMELSEDMVRQRSCREGWLKSPEAKAAVLAAHANRSAAHTLEARGGRHHPSPAQLLAAELAGLGAKSRLSLARGVQKASEHIESLPGAEILENAQNVKSVAATASLVHGWDSATPTVKLRLDLVSAPGGEQEAPAIDIESSVVFDGEPMPDCDADL